MSHSLVENSRKATILLTVAALGVVYGDIGTSPLYALKESFHYVEPTRLNVLGILSLMLWSILVVVTLKYVLFLLNTSHHGEGGITALIGLVKKKVHSWHIILGIFGVALLYGDGMITPAISVLSAVEGLRVITPAAEKFVIPITVLILIVLFSVQRYGTQKVGTAFGPIMIVWFVIIGMLGLNQIISYPAILAAINPFYAVQFFYQNGLVGFFTLGAIVLVVTGGEALYADMGHFGKLPVRLGWLTVALPSLLLNYFGQAALIIEEPEVAEFPFYALAPEWFQWPLVIIATLATIIASQALITGAYSLTRQLIDLHALPALEIVSTSVSNHGQIYVPLVNKLLLVGCITLVLFFQSSSALAAAYGIAVTGTMAITTWLWYLTLVNVKGWRKLEAISLLIIFVSIDITFFAANIVKFFQGGWIPITIAFVLTWGMEWYYFHSRSLLRVKKQPLEAMTIYDVKQQATALILLDEYAHCGTKLLIDAARFMSIPYKLVHFATREERVPQLRHFVQQLGEEVEVISTPSGDILRPAEEYVLSHQRMTGGAVWVFLGQTIVKGEMEELHPNGSAIMRKLQRHPGIIVTRVPWVIDPVGVSVVNISAKSKGLLPIFAKSNI